MATPASPKTTDVVSRAKPRKIIGISFSPETAAEIKMEATRRGIQLNVLFMEMWARYKKEKKN